MSLNKDRNVFCQGSFDERICSAIQTLGIEIDYPDWVEQAKAANGRLVPISKNGRFKACLTKEGNALRLKDFGGGEDAWAIVYLEDAKGSNNGNPSDFGTDSYLRSKGFSDTVISKIVSVACWKNEKGTFQDILLETDSGETTKTEDGRTACHYYRRNGDVWEKRFSSGKTSGRFGCFTPINFTAEAYKRLLKGESNVEEIYIAEGVATAVSAFLALRKAAKERYFVFSAHDKNNLRKVTEYLSSFGKRIFVLMDVDKEGKKENGKPIIERSLEDFQNVSERYPFKPSLASLQIKSVKSGYDFNDYLGTTPDGSFTPSMGLDGNGFRKVVGTIWGTLEKEKEPFTASLRAKEAEKKVGEDLEIPLLKESAQTAKTEVAVPEVALDEVAAEEVKKRKIEGEIVPLEAVVEGIGKEEKKEGRSLEEMRASFDAFQMTLERDKKGNITDNSSTYELIFKRDDFFADMGFNTLTKTFVSSEAPDMPLQIADVKRKFMSVVSGAKSTKTLEDYIKSEANNPRRAFDPLRAWVRSLPEWDGKHRLCHLFPMLGCVENEASKIAGIYFGVSVVRKALMPNVSPENDAMLCTNKASEEKGEKTDLMVVMVDPDGGTGKTDSLGKLMPFYRAKGSFSATDADFARASCQNLLLIFNELAGINSKATAEGIKDRIGDRTDSYRPLYADVVGTYYKRAVYVGSCNSNLRIADDKALCRRFLFLDTIADGGKGKAKRDAWLLRNREQMYAEALVLSSDWDANKGAYEQAEGRDAESVRDNAIWPIYDYLVDMARSSSRSKVLKDMAEDDWIDRAEVIAERAGQVLSDGTWLEMSVLYKDLEIELTDNRATNRVRKALESAGWEIGRKRIYKGQKNPVTAARVPLKRRKETTLEEDKALLSDTSKRPIWLNRWIED